MPRKAKSALIAIERIERQIYVVRGQRVMLDTDLAALYGVSAMVLNQGVKRNATRFPDDFAFRLTLQEFRNLKSQIVTSSLDHGGRRKLPWAFTEQGVAMLSSVLHSPMAIRVNIEIMRAFVRLRRLLATPGDLVVQLTKLAETVQLHDDKIKEIIAVLQAMLQPPREPKRQFGFYMPDRAAKTEAKPSTEPTP